MSEHLTRADQESLRNAACFMFGVFQALGDEEGMRQASAQENEMRRLIYGPCDVDDELAQLKLESQT